MARDKTYLVHKQTGKSQLAKDNQQAPTSNGKNQNDKNVGIDFKAAIITMLQEQRQTNENIFLKS